MKLNTDINLIIFKYAGFPTIGQMLTNGDRTKFIEIVNVSKSLKTCMVNIFGIDGGGHGLYTCDGRSWSRSSSWVSCPFEVFNKGLLIEKRRKKIRYCDERYYVDGCYRTYERTHSCRTHRMLKDRFEKDNKEIEKLEKMEKA